MLKSPLLWALLLMVFVAGCKKEEIITVPDNVAPPDRTIEDITVENYVNRTYISLLGRKAEDAELDADFATLRAGNFSRDARRTFVQGLADGPEFENRLYYIARALYLNASDTTEIREQRDFFVLLLTQPQYQAFYPQLEHERDRLNAVLAIPAGLANGSIDVRDMHKRLSDNYIYDQINMGTQNFVISMFQNFLFRYPTDAELADAERMVDGLTSTSFLQSGRNKDDFIRIFFDTGDYFEGQVREVHVRLLFREPTAQELSTLSVSYLNGDTHADLLREVLSTDEFAGI